MHGPKKWPYHIMMIEIIFIALIEIIGFILVNDILALINIVNMG